MEIDRQNTWGGLISIDLFLGGMGAGIFFISFIMDLFNKFEFITKIGYVFGPIFVLSGTIILFFDLSNKSAGLWKIFKNSSSWVTRGTWFITFFLLLSIFYTIPYLGLFNLDTWDKSLLRKIVGWIAFIFSFLIMLYPGLIFSSTKRIPIWNSPALPLLFIFSNLYTGMAFLLFLSHFFLQVSKEDFYSLLIIEIFLIFIQILLLGLFLLIRNYWSTTAAESIKILLKMRLFSFGVLTMGLIIPLGLLIYYVFTSISNTNIIIFLASILIIAGSLFLRYCILKAGIRVPLYSI